jgi:hypothetical protein
LRCIRELIGRGCRLLDTEIVEIEDELDFTI